MARKQLARKFIITVRGNTEDDLEMALDEAVRGVKTGCYVGHNSNDTGAYYFESTDDVPRAEQPA